MEFDPWTQSLVNAMSSVWAPIAGFIPRLFGSLVVVLLGFVVAKLLDTLLSKLLAKLGLDRLMAGTAESLKARGMGDQAAGMPRDVFEPEARRRVTIGLVLAEVVKAENIRAEPDQVKAVIEEYAQSYEQPDDVVRWYYQSPERLREIESVVIENNVVDLLLGRLKVSEKVVAFDELMGNVS